MKLTAMNDMSEEMVSAQELSDDELETVSGGFCGLNGNCDKPQDYELHHCVRQSHRDIYEGGFANCASTVEDDSWCDTNDACYGCQVVYDGMGECHKAWRQELENHNNN